MRPKGRALMMRSMWGQRGKAAICKLGREISPGSKLLASYSWSPHSAEMWEINVWCLSFSVCGTLFPEQTKTPHYTLLSSPKAILTSPFLLFIINQRNVYQIAILQNWYQITIHAGIQTFCLLVHYIIVIMLIRPERKKLQMHLGHWKDICSPRKRKMKPMELQRPAIPVIFLESYGLGHVGKTSIKWKDKVLHHFGLKGQHILYFIDSLIGDSKGCQFSLGSRA